MDQGRDNQVVAGSTALDRARHLSSALSEVARRARYSTRSRRQFTGSNFRARRGARMMRIFITVSFVVMVAIPTLTAAFYYAFIASDQYVAETRFTVSSGEMPKLDGIGMLTGIPSSAVIQNTQIVTNYIQSRAAVEKLERAVDLRRLYSRPEADFWTRLNPDKPIEKMVKYWRHMTEVSIKMPAGIVEFTVRAFTPQDAALIGNAVLDISEGLINDLNGRMNRDAIGNAEQELDRASDRITRARVALERARDEGGLIDATKAVEALNGLVTDTRSTLLQLQQEYATQRKAVREDAPQMRALKSRIDSTQEQIAELESKLTNTQKGAPNETTLAVSMTKFSELDLERQISERLYAAAATTLEMSRLRAERKAMYLNPFVTPVVPEDSQYPRRLLFVFLIAAGTTFAWGACCGFAVLTRNYMA